MHLFSTTEPEEVADPNPVVTREGKKIDKICSYACDTPREVVEGVGPALSTRPSFIARYDLGH